MSLTATVAVLAIFVSLWQPACAWNYTLTVRNDDRRVIDLGVFGFSEMGRMELTLNEITVPKTKNDQATANKIGFSLDLVATAVEARQERNEAGAEAKKHHMCFIDDKALSGNRPRYHIPLAAQLDGDVTTLKGVNATFSVSTPGLYAFFFYNCRDISQSAASPVTFTVDVRQYNLYTNADGAPAVSFLGVGDDNVPAMYLVFALFFVAGAIAWHRALRERPRRVFAVHHMMYALVVIKIITLLLNAAVLQHRKKTGGLKYGLDYVYYAFQTLKGVMLFTCILLLGTGWSTLKPFLSERDKKVLYVVLPLQVLANLALAVLEETSEGNKSWTRYRELLRMFDIICCCAILLPVVWSIKTLNDSGAEGANNRNLARLRQFRTFYIAVVSFIYFTRIVIPLADTQLPYRLTWSQPSCTKLARCSSTPSAV